MGHTPGTRDIKLLANLPNLITVARILLTPVLVIFLINGRITAALVVFVIAGLSDGLDGFIARMMRNKTRFGEITDPLADKLLLDTTYVTLAVGGRVPAWLAVIVLSRDFLIITGIALLTFFDRPVTIKPLFSSKVTTFFQISTIAVILSADLFTMSTRLMDAAILATAGLTIISGGQYLVMGFRMLAAENGGGGDSGE